MPKVQRYQRYSAKCKLCKARWTTEEKDRTAAFNAHEPKCARYAEIFGKRRAYWPKLSEASERYQMSALYFEHIQIQGYFVADKKCDGRCMGATGHNCECSCGGANHGVASCA